MERVTPYNKSKYEADLGFLKITETIFKVFKDKKDVFSGSLYVSDKEVLDSLNYHKVIIYNDPHGFSFHKNF